MCGAAQRIALHGYKQSVRKGSKKASKEGQLRILLEWATRGHKQEERRNDKASKERKREKWMKRGQVITFWLRDEDVCEHLLH